MEAYIALLRGINVSGQKKIKMADLRILLEKSGLKNVRTYIQSGNVLFCSNQKNKQQLEVQISKAIKNHYGFDIPILVKTRNEIRDILNHNPYNDQEDLANNKIYFVLLKELPDEDRVKNLSTVVFENETFVYSPACIYLRCALGAGKAKCNNNFFEAKLKVASTIRNYKTMTKLLEMNSRPVR